MGRDFVPYMSDAWISMRRELVDNFAVRSLRIRKIRGGAAFDGPLPFVVGPNGLSVSAPTPVEVAHEVRTERMSSGIERLDTLLGGGYLRGSAVLVSGAPGTAKTSLAVVFLAAACAAGERCLLVSFDEAGEQIVRNARSIGIDLEPAVADGRLQLLSLRSGATGIEPLMDHIISAIDHSKPHCIVIDPLSAALRAPGRLHPVNPGQRLIDCAKSSGATILTTSLTENRTYFDVIDTESNVSTIADTWLHVSYGGTEGERNRSISIIKSRGSRHSHQVRELTISDRGLDLEDVYTVGGTVLMGTARMEKEAEVAEEESQRQRAITRSIREVEAERLRLSREVERTEALMRLRDEEIEEMRTANANREASDQARRHLIFGSRRGDTPETGTE